MHFNVGNTEGQYFTQWRFDELKDLAGLINEQIGVAEFNLFYDPIQDFHHLAFEYNGHKADIRLYRVFSESVDGKDGWVGCPTNYAYGFVDALCKKLKEPATV